MSDNKTDKFYAMLYQPIFVDAGIVSYKPLKLVEGFYDAKRETFTIKGSNDDYDCVDKCIPLFGKKDDCLLSSIGDEIEDILNTSELFYGFPIHEKILSYYMNNDDAYKDVTPLEAYEKELRCYFLFSMYDAESDDNVFYLADKIDNHDVYLVDPEMDVVSTLNDAAKDDNVPNQIIISINGLANSAEEEEEQEDENEEKPKLKPYQKINAETTSFTPIIRDFDPDELEKDIKEEVIGQDHVASALVSMIYKNMRYYEQRGLKSNMLILGPSGCGKTELIRSINRHLNIPMTIFDATTTSATGYVGNSIGQCIRDLISVCNGDVEKAENGIIVIDEIDKLAGGDGVTKGDVQDELLKMLDGDEVTLPSENHLERPIRFNTKNVTFIGVGAAQAIINNKIKEKRQKPLGFAPDASKTKEEQEENEVVIEPEDLLKFGLKAELLRRFPVIKVVKNLSENQLVTILSDSKISNFNLYKKAFEDVDHVKLVCNRPVLEEMAKKAKGEKAGASGLKRIVDDTFQVAVRKIRLLNGDNGRLIISKQTIEDPTKFKLYRVKGKEKELVYPPTKMKKLMK